MDSRQYRVVITEARETKKVDSHLHGAKAVQAGDRSWGDQHS